MGCDAELGLYLECKKTEILQERIIELSKTIVEKDELLVKAFDENNSLKDRLQRAIGCLECLKDLTWKGSTEEWNINQTLLEIR